MRVSVLITVFNRKEKTKRCLESLQSTVQPYLKEDIDLEVFLTDDGSTDGTQEMLAAKEWSFPFHVLQGDGSLFWNGGMIKSWKAALAVGGFDGYLWLNNDTIVLQNFWKDLLAADNYSAEHFGKTGIYVGSTKDSVSGTFTYGGFVYTNKLTLKDRFIMPDGTHFQECEAAHGNITYVSSEVVDRMGIFCEKYHHGGADHDYTYLAHKANFPVLVLPHYSGVCDNDHLGKTRRHTELSLNERLKCFWKPNGFNMHNTLLFNNRCFPWRMPFVLFSGIIKVLFPKLGYGLYLKLRTHGR